MQNKVEFSAITKPCLDAGNENVFGCYREQRVSSFWQFHSINSSLSLCVCVFHIRKKFCFAWNNRHVFGFVYLFTTPYAKLLHYHIVKAGCRQHEWKTSYRNRRQFVKDVIQELQLNIVRFSINECHATESNEMKWSASPPRHTAPHRIAPNSTGKATFHGCLLFAKRIAWQTLRLHHYSLKMKCFVHHVR